MATPTFRVKKNNYVTKSVTVQYADGTAYDLTGKEVHFAVKFPDDKLEDDSKAVIKKQYTTYTNATLGQFTLELVENDTINLDEGNYRFDFRIISTSTGRCVNTQSGNFVIEPIVTMQ